MPRILIAEDDPMNQLLLKNILTEAGHDIYISPSGDHALSTLKAFNTFDILVTDVMMPGLDGRELISKINQDKDIPTMPIIIISGVIKSSEVWGLLESGAAYFLPKPVKKDELLEYIAYCEKDSDTLKEKK